jgi:hypothetical protein
MSNKRIINIENGGPAMKPAETMEELLTSAEQDWKFKQRDRAFVKVLGAIAMMSQGIAMSIRSTEAAVRAVQANCVHRYPDTNPPTMACEKCGWTSPK